MSLPELFTQKIDFLTQYIGGYNELKKHLDEYEIGTIALFHGPIALLTPYSVNKTDSQGDLVLDDFGKPIPILTSVFNLGLIEYRSNSYYSVLDKNFNYLYSNIAEEEEVEGELNYFFGTAQQDRELIWNSKDGDFYYIYYENEKRPRLALILVYRSLPQSAKRKIINTWRNIAKETTRESNLVYNELVIKNDLGLRGIKVALLDGVWASVYEDSERIFDNYDANELVFESDEIIYLRFKQNTWLTIKDAHDNKLYLKDINGFGLRLIRETSKGVYYFKTSNNASGVGRQGQSTSITNSLLIGRGGNQNNFKLIATLSLS